MQFCDKHWQNLRASVSKYGLDHLIAPDGKAAAEMMARQLEGTDTPIDFDPLMAAHNQLLDVAVNFVGLKVMGDTCPVCELERYEWTDGAAYQSMLYAQKNGLMLEEATDG
jgi:hypothetical protein